VGGGENCAVDTEVSKQSNVGRNETMVGSSKVVVGHTLSSNNLGQVVHTPQPVGAMPQFGGIMEHSFPRTFAPGNKSSIHGTFAPWNFRS